MDALTNLFGDDKKSKKKTSRPVIITKLNFNPTKFPSGSVLSFSLLLLIIAGGLFFVSNLIPQIGNSSIRESVLESTRNFELEDEINGGLFSSTSRKGDTSHSIQSTFMGVSILNGNIKNVKGAKDFLQKLQLTNFEENLEYINYGVRMLKVLGLLDVSEYSAKALVDRLYNQILGHQEQGVGFRITKFSSPSIAASFYALDALSVLGKLEEFKKTSEFSNVIQYILSQKVSGGFIEREGENATLTATYFATRTLLFDSSNQDTLREMGEIASFIYERQGLNGAFLEDFEEYDINSLNSYTTLQALFSLYSLVEAGVEDGGVFSEFSSSASKGAGYVRSVLRGGRGVRSSLSLSTIHLPSNYLFIQLIDSFPHFNYGTVPEIKNILLGVSILLSLYALYQFYREQIEDKRTLKTTFISSRNILILLSVSLLSLYFVPSFSILFYLFTFTFIGIRFFSSLQSEANTNVSDFLSAPLLTAFIHLLLLILLNSSTNGNCFTTFYYYYIFAVWSAISAFLSTYIFINLMQNRKTQFYLASAFIGWVFSMITTILYLTGSEAWKVSLQLIQINGQFPLLLVVLPFLSLCLSYPAALLPLVF